MAKRLLNCNASDFLSMNREELLNAIHASEGRTVLSENIASGDRLILVLLIVRLHVLLEQILYF